MNGRKLAAFALSGVMAVGLTACGGNGEPNESPAGGSGGEAYLVGICQLAPTTRWTQPPGASRRLWWRPSARMG